MENKILVASITKFGGHFDELYEFINILYRRIEYIYSEQYLIQRLTGMTLARHFGDSIDEYFGKNDAYKMTIHDEGSLSDKMITISVDWNRRNTIFDDEYFPVYHPIIKIYAEQKTNTANNTINTKSSVNHPSHYSDGKIEVIDFIKDKKLNFQLGNAVKYISRAGKKDPNKTIEDLEKAVWYLEDYIKDLKKEG